MKIKGTVENVPCRLMVLSLLVAAPFISPGCARSTDGQAPVVLSIEGIKGKIVCVGDSLTAAEGVPREQGFAAKLARRSNQITVIQQGRSGWPTTAYLRRMDDVLEALPTDAGVIVIQLGANDLRVDGHSDETVARTVANMGRIIDVFRAHSPEAKIVVMTPPTMIPEKLTPRLRQAGFGPHSPPVLGRLSDAYRDLAASKNCGFIDLFPVLANGDTLDGAHPNDSGHTKIADEIWHRLTGGPRHGAKP